MTYLREATVRQIKSIENKFRLSESMGLGVTITFQVDEVQALLGVMRETVLHIDIADRVERGTREALKWRWAMTWFAIGILVAGIVR